MITTYLLSVFLLFSCFSSNSLISLSELTTDFERGIEGTSVWQGQIQIFKQGQAA